MKIKCPNCGELVVIHGFGRKPLNIGVKNVCDALEKHRNVAAAADELDCSRAYIYQVLKENDIDPRNFVKKNGG